MTIWSGAGMCPAFDTAFKTCFAMSKPIVLTWFMDGLSSSCVILNDHTLALQMPGAEAVHPISLLFAARADCPTAAAFLRQKVNCPRHLPGIREDMTAAPISADP